MFTPEQRREYTKRFMTAARGLTAYETAVIFNTHFQGLDWRGVSKGRMAKDAFSPGYALATTLAAEALLQHLEQAPRVDHKAERAARKQVKAIDIEERRRIELKKICDDLSARFDQLGIAAYRWQESSIVFPLKHVEVILRFLESREDDFEKFYGLFEEMEGS
jgi:hypothetical protein